MKYFVKLFIWILIVLACQWCIRQFDSIADPFIRAELDVTAGPTMKWTYLLARLGAALCVGIFYCVLFYALFSSPRKGKEP